MANSVDFFESQVFAFLEQVHAFVNDDSRVNAPVFVDRAQDVFCKRADFFDVHFLCPFVLVLTIIQTLENRPVCTLGSLAGLNSKSRPVCIVGSPAGLNFYPDSFVKVVEQNFPRLLQAGNQKRRPDLSSNSERNDARQQEIT